MHPRLAKGLHTVTHPVLAIGGAVVIGALVLGFAWQAAKVTPSGQYTPAVMAPISAVGGGNSDLSFQASGQVASIPVTIGQQVSAGTVLVALDRAALQASRAGAIANLEAATAKLAALKAGTRPEQIAVDQTAVTQSQESLRDAVRSSYITADDAIHNKADQFFINPRSTSAVLSFTLPDQVLQNTVQGERIALESMFSDWEAYANRQAFVATDPIEDGKYAQTQLTSVAVFLNDVAAVLAKVPTSSTLPLATLQGYQASINAARLSVSGSVSAITNATTALRGAQGVLTLAQAGATVNDIAAAQAVVDSAQAVVSGIDVSLRNATLVAPIDGTVTALNAHVGQTVSLGQVIVSIESSGGTKKSALVIPKSSIIENSGTAFVYVRSASGTPVKTPVTVGLVSAGDMAEIVSGLSAGQEVLTFGTTI